jgi:anti-sigma regulatory factor (Ser/Thr protein kinase)
MSSRTPAEPGSGQGGAPRELRIALANDLGLVGSANEELEAFLQRWEIRPEVVFSAALALEEVVTNIIKYAYADAARHEILVEARIDADEVVLRVSDDGREFDILSAAPPHMDKPIEERPPGGLGIHILRNIARRIEYERAEGRNTLLLSIALNP